jgi:hypothetical protein
VLFTWNGEFLPSIGVFQRRMPTCAKPKSIYTKEHEYYLQIGNPYTHNHFAFP